MPNNEIDITKAFVNHVFKCLCERMWSETLLLSDAYNVLTFVEIELQVWIDEGKLRVGKNHEI